MKNIEPFVSGNLSLFKRRYAVHCRIADLSMDAAPLVDIALIVFLFFLISSSYVVQPGIEIKIPETKIIEGMPFSSLVVTLTQEGMIFFNDERTTLEGLPEVFSRMAYENPEHSLMIRADDRIPHHRIIKIYNMATGAGIKKVALAVQMEKPEGVGSKAR